LVEGWSQWLVPFAKLNSKIPPNASVSNQAVSLTGTLSSRAAIIWVGRWIYRRRRSGDYSTESIGTADDRDEADGVSILDFQQARAKAVELSLDEGRPAGRITVSRAIADYIDYLSASGKLTSTVLKAALNHAFDEGRISSNAAWGRRVKKYRGVASTRARLLDRGGGETVLECL
jgi:hypothetical protein